MTPTAFVDIALPLPVGQTFTYHLTPYQQERIRPGARVRVPVGRRRMTGYVVATREAAPEGFATRAIEALIDREPVLPGGAARSRASPPTTTWRPWATCSRR